MERLIKVEKFVTQSGRRYAQVEIFETSNRCHPGKKKSIGKGYIALYGEDNKLNVWYDTFGC